MTAAASPERLGPEDVRRTCGDILDWRVAAIVETGGTTRDLAAALALADTGADALGDQHLELEGAAAVIYDLLVMDEEARDG